jgi:hypothetical protein
VIEKEVRDHIAPVGVMLGQAVVQNPMHMKQIDEKLLPIEKRTIARLVSRTPYSLLVAEVPTEENAVVIVTSTSPTVVAETIQ